MDDRQNIDAVIVRIKRKLSNMQKDQINRAAFGHMTHKNC